MEPKWNGWKEGIISEDLRSISGGTGHKKGDTVRYRRKKTIPDRDGMRLTEYEWHYMDTNNYNLVRSWERIIEGLPKIREPWKD